MDRREFMTRASGWLAASAALRGQHAGMTAPVGPAQDIVGDADITLRVSDVTIELAPRRTFKTIGYNGGAQGPLLRVRKGRPITVDVWNHTTQTDIVHYHGLHIPPEVDGAYEEGTPGIPGNGGRRRYAFTPEPAGTRWYHSHNPGGRNVAAGPYSAQFGMMIVEDGTDAGAYDLEVPLLLHDWDGRVTDRAVADVEYKYASINGKMLGAGEPIRVRQGQVLFLRIVNASATAAHRLALPGHRFRVTALDGNPVARPQLVPVIDLGPGERADALVEMNQPGVWVLGDTDDRLREAGMGVVVEYAGGQGAPRWLPAPPFDWDYAIFGEAAEPAVRPDGELTLVLKPKDNGHDWTINGKMYPQTDTIVVQANKRYRWTFDNQSALPHPMHLHRHTFELVKVGDTPMSGVWKDVVVVPPWKQVEVDVPTTQPGLSLMHCHQQLHMDMGMMTLMTYKG